MPLRNKVTKIKKEMGIAKGNIYFLPKVRNILSNYLISLNITSKEFWGKINIFEIKKVFLLSLRDFFEERIFLDQLSTIANSLYYNDKIWTLFEINSADGKLGTALDMASELAYYNWRKKKNKSTMKLYQSALKIVEEYYKENKEVVRELSNNVQS